MTSGEVNRRWLFVVLGLVLVAVAAVVACGDDDSASDGERRSLDSILTQHGGKGDFFPEDGSDAPANAGGSQGASTPPDQAASDLVRQHYALIDEGAFEEAWEFLDSGVQGQFGGFSSWSGGYATSVSNEVLSADPTSTSGGTVELSVRIRSTDRCSGQSIVREFQGPWTIDTETEKVTSASFEQVGGGSLPSGCQ